MSSTTGSTLASATKLIATQQQQSQQWRPPAAETAVPLHVQSFERSLDVTGFISQLERLLATSLETASAAVFAECGALPVDYSQGQSAVANKSMLTTKGIWEDDHARKRDLSCLYNFSTLAKRKWLKNVLLDESDSDSDSEQVITERDLKILLKIHKYRRKYQKRYHTDILNSQYTYFGAGLLSEHDRFPEHQKFILAEYGFTIPPPPTVPLAPAAAVTNVAASPAKRSPVKRRRNSSRVNNIMDSHGKRMSVAAAIGSESFSAINDQRSAHLSSSSEFNSPLSSPSPFPSFAVPLTRLQSSSATSAVLADNRSTIAVASSVPSLVRPVMGPPNGDLSPGALRWRAWKAIAMEDIPKAHTERIIQRKYHSVVLKQIALYCSQFLEQARDATVSGKHKSGSRHGKKPHSGGQIIGLRPVNKPQHAGTSSK